MGVLQKGESRRGDGLPWLVVDERERLHSWTLRLGGTIVTYLEITTRNGLGRRTVELRDRPLRIGRASENDVVLKDTRVSRHHCVVEVLNGRALIRDLGSRRGIKVNNRKREESDLRPGDRVRVGPFVIVLRDESRPSPSVHVKPKRASVLDDWDDDVDGGNDETATPDVRGLPIVDDDSRDESSGDSDGSASASTGVRAGLDEESAERLEALGTQMAQLEATLGERDDTLAALSQQLADMRAMQQSLAVPANAEQDDRADALREAMEAQHAAMLERLEALEGRLADATAAAEKASTAEQRATDSADRLDQFATDHEQLAFEHTQVARAVQDLATRLDSIEESLEPVRALSNRLASLEASIEQNATLAKQAIEQSQALLARLEEVSDQAEAAEARSAEAAANQAESAASVKVHDETLKHGSDQLVKFAKLVEELNAKHQASAAEREQLNANVRSMMEQLAQMREWSDEFEERMAQASAAPARDEDASGHAAEVAILRDMLEEFSDKVSSRLERLEGASADAAPELSALKEQVRKLSQQQTMARDVSSGRTPAESRRPAPTATAVMDQPAPVAAPVPKSAPRSAPRPKAEPAAIDAEQSRQVMSQIFQPKEAQDERYKPVRDHSMIVLFIIVIVIGIGVALALLGPMLQGQAAGT